MTLCHSCIHSVVVGISGLRFLNEIKRISGWHDNPDPASKDLIAMGVPSGLLLRRLPLVPYFTEIALLVVRMFFRRFGSLLDFLNLPP